MILFPAALSFFPLQKLFYLGCITPSVLQISADTKSVLFADFLHTAIPLATFIVSRRHKNSKYLNLCLLNALQA